MPAELPQTQSFASIHAHVPHAFGRADGRATAAEGRFNFDLEGQTECQGEENEANSSLESSTFLRVMGNNQICFLD